MQTRSYLTDTVKIPSAQITALFTYEVNLQLLKDSHYVLCRTYRLVCLPKEIFVRKQPRQIGQAQAFSNKNKPLKAERMKIS